LNLLEELNLLNEKKKVTAAQIAKILKGDDWGMTARGGNGRALVKGGNLVIKDPIYFMDQKKFDRMDKEWTSPSGTYAKYFKDEFGITFKLVSKNHIMKKLDNHLQHYEMVLKIV